MNIAMPIVPTAGMLRKVAPNRGNIANLLRTNLNRGLVESGKNRLYLRVIFQFGDSDISPYRPGSLARLNSIQSGQRLHIYQDVRLGDVLFHFPEQIDTAGEVPSASSQE